MLDGNSRARHQDFKMADIIDCRLIILSLVRVSLIPFLSVDNHYQDDCSAEANSSSSVGHDKKCIGISDWGEI